MRIPYAMRAMIDEIAKDHGDASFETQDPDGFGVWRTLLIDPETTKAYTPLLDELIDQRILSKDIRGDGRYAVRFVSDQRADNATPFYLDKALAVLRDDGSTTIEEIVEEADDLAAEDRRKELQAIRVTSLRGYLLKDGTTFTPQDKKRDVIDRILIDEGF